MTYMIKLSKKQIALIIIVTVLASVVVAFMFEPQWAYATRDVFVEQVWDPGTKAGASALSTLWTSSAWQTYVAPYDWAISGILCLIMGLIVIPKLWQKFRGRKGAGPKIDTSMEFQREPAEPETTPKLKTSPEPSPTLSKEESTT